MIAAGFGFRAACAPSDLRAALEAALSQHGVARAELALLAAPSFRPDLVAALGRELPCPVLRFDAEALRRCPIATLTMSAHVLPRYGVGSVAEACALLAVLSTGAAGAHLLGPRAQAGSATCALAISESSS